LPANVAKAAAQVLAVSDRAEEDVAGHAMVVEVEAAVMVAADQEVHHATIATNPVISLAIARSPELRRATTVARMATFLASVMLPIPAEAAVVVEVAADRTAVDVVAIATAVANLDTFHVNARRVAAVIRATIVSATLAEASAISRGIALRALTVLEEKMVTTKSTTDSRST